LAYQNIPYLAIGYWLLAIGAPNGRHQLVRLLTNQVRFLLDSQTANS
jgi:hypothetical protein